MVYVAEEMSFSKCEDEVTEMVLSGMMAAGAAGFGNEIWWFLEIGG